mgnify:CR=1 FL=1
MITTVNIKAQPAKITAKFTPNPQLQHFHQICLQKYYLHYPVQRSVAVFHSHTGGEKNFLRVFPKEWIVLDRTLDFIFLKKHIKRIGRLHGGNVMMNLRKLAKYALTTGFAFGLIAGAGTVTAEAGFYHVYIQFVLY